MLFKLVFFANVRKRTAKLIHIPMQRVGLAAKGIKPGFIEVGRCERQVHRGQETPGAKVEHLARDVDIVGVQNAVHKPGGHQFRALNGDLFGNQREELERPVLRAAGGCFAQ